MDHHNHFSIPSALTSGHNHSTDNLMNDGPDPEEQHLQFLSRQIVPPSPLQPPHHDAHIQSPQRPVLNAAASVIQTVASSPSVVASNDKTATTISSASASASTPMLGPNSSISVNSLINSMNPATPMTPISPFTPSSADPGIVPQLQNIVSTVNLGCKLDLKKIALHARNAEYNPKRFAAVIMRIREPRTTALIFSSGKMVCTGAKSEEQSRLAARKYARIVQKLGFEAKFSDFKIQNMVGSCDVKFPIRLEGLVLTHSQFSSYEPELFPGLIYRMVKPRIVLLIFVSGKVVLTGVKIREEIYRGFYQILPSIIQFAGPIKADATDQLKALEEAQNFLKLCDEFYTHSDGLQICAKVRTEIYEAFDNIYPILKSFRKQ